jgi:hypothetical protein
MHGPLAAGTPCTTVVGGVEQVSHLPLELDRSRRGDHAGASGIGDPWTKTSRVPRLHLAPRAHYSRRPSSRQVVRDPHIGQRGSREIKATIP